MPRAPLGDPHQPGPPLDGVSNALDVEVAAPRWQPEVVSGRLAGGGPSSTTQSRGVTNGTRRTASGGRRQPEPDALKGSIRPPLRGHPDPASKVMERGGRSVSPPARSLGPDAATAADRWLFETRPAALCRRRGDVDRASPSTLPATSAA
jgi:hypothetical protein